MTELALRPDSAGPRLGGDLRPSNRGRDCIVGIGSGRSAVAAVPPRGAAERERRPRMAAAPRRSRPTGPGTAGDGGAAARFDRSPIAPGERRETPEPSR